MTPAARLQAAIELLSEIESGLLSESQKPADRRVAAYFAARRYMGAKDRRAVAAYVYGTLRCRARLLWWAGRIGLEPDGEAVGRARSLILSDLMLNQGSSPAEIDRLFDGERHHPPRLTPNERSALAALTGASLDHSEQPAPVALELPDWLWPLFEQVFGVRAPDELRALRAEAPLDLRVNSLRIGRPEALAILASEGFAAAPTPWSPLGLRLSGRPRLQDSRLWREGAVEPQDEAAQLAVLLCEARPGMSVADLCAGAGGKTLGLADAMENRGELLAVDCEAGRLDELRRRARRAGVAGLTVRQADATEATDLPERHFDRVLVDAPCSGTGTWRRSPDAPWRLTPERLAACCNLQSRLLDAAARTVRPGGRLIYATCSLLPCENAEQVEAFRARTADFERVSVGEVWREAVGQPQPQGMGDDLLLTPARHGCDGFFVAVLKRRAEDRA